MKTKGYWIIAILSIVIPALYLSMYLPIWNGKELSLAKNIFASVLFVFQCICLVFGILNLFVDKISNSNRCLLHSASVFFFIASLLLTLFVGSFFLMELLNIPWFPAQQ